MTPLAYCYNQDGYFTHSEVCQRDPLESEAQGHDIFMLPADACSDAPIIADGCVAKRVNGSWVNVENHVGENGFVNGVPTTISEYGPLPEGWSETLPPPLLTSAKSAKRVAIAAGFDAAMAASLTMPTASASPSAYEVATAIFEWRTDDPDGYAALLAIHTARRADLLAAVDAATTAAEVQAIIVSYAV